MRIGPMEGIWLSLELLLLLGVANSAPIAARRLLGDRWAAPLDFGLNFVDGRPLLGRGKTIRGEVDMWKDIIEQTGKGEFLGYELAKVKHKIDGAAAGSTTLKNCALPRQPSIAAASNSLGSTERTPKMVFSRMG